jgi:hypothetical protein
MLDNVLLVACSMMLLLYVLIECWLVCLLLIQARYALFLILVCGSITLDLGTALLLMLCICFVDGSLIDLELSIITSRLCSVLIGKPIGRITFRRL